MVTSLRKAESVLQCAYFVVPWLLWPVSLATVLIFGYRSFRAKKFVESLPLLLSQLNAALIWSLQASYSVGQFNSSINGKHLIKGSFYSMRTISIIVLLSNAYYLEPLNIFLYTWRFFRVIEQDEPKKWLKLFYRWFARITIFVLPLSTYALFIGFLITESKSLYSVVHAQIKEADHYEALSNYFLDLIGYLTIVTNLVSCIILILVLRLITKITKAVVFGREKLEKSKKIDRLVTSSHVCLIFGYTIASTLAQNVTTNRQFYYERVSTAYIIVAGIADLFLSLIIWFVSDEKPPAIIMDGDRAYAVINVIQNDSTLINNDNDDEDEPPQRRLSIM